MSATTCALDKVVDDVEGCDPVSDDRQPFLHSKPRSSGTLGVRRHRIRRCFRGCLVIPTVSLFVLVLLLVLCLVSTEKLSHHSKYDVYRHAAVASDAAPCSDVGRDVLMENGSAVDAAVATLFCLGIHDAHFTGIGGGFFMVVYDTPRGKKKKRMLAIDARETAPASATPHMFDNCTQPCHGGITVAVPGEVAGCYEAWKRFGWLPWRRLVQPAIDMCRHGYPVLWSLADAIKRKEPEIRQSPSLRAQFVKSDGSLFTEGDVMYCEKLANTLDMIAQDNGVWNMYNGTLAHSIVQDLNDIGGIITTSDLSQYRVRIYPALSVSLRSGLVIHTLRPPSSGAILAFMLRVLEGFNFTSASRDDVDTFQRIVETFKFGYSERTYLGDEMFANVSEVMQNLTSWSFADYIRGRIDVNRTHNINYYHPAVAAEPLDTGTTHLSIQSPGGAAVAVTSTVNSLFGSKRIGERTGILFNDEMNDFLSPKPVTFANRVEPGKRPQSSMCPAIILDPHGNVVMVIGAAGEALITSATAYVAAHKLFFGVPIYTAVDVLRLHHQLVPNVLQYEHGFDQMILDGLEEKGHTVSELTMHSVVQAIFDRFRHSSSSSRREKPFPRHARYYNEPCIEAVSDWRRRGAPSGF